MLFSNVARARLYRAAVEHLGGGEEVSGSLAAAIARTIAESLTDADLGRIGDSLFSLLVEQGVRILRVREHAALSLEAVDALLKDEGDPQPVTVIQVLMADQPFIYDSIRLALTHAGVEPEFVTNFVLAVRRNADGTAKDVDIGTSDPADREALVQIVLPPLEGSDRDALAETIRDRLTRARDMVRDFEPMRRAVHAARAGLEAIIERRQAGGSVEESARDLAKSSAEEAAGFLSWILDEHFVIMGAELHRATLSDKEGWSLEVESRLGSATHEAFITEDAGEILEAAALSGSALGTPLRVRKLPIESALHRAGLIDEILAVYPAEKGSFFVLVVRGLFTFRALRRPGAEIPVLRRKLEQLLRANGLIERSFRYKAYVNAFNSLPVEFLFEASVADITAVLDTVLAAEEQAEPHSHVVLGPRGLSLYALAALPQELFTDEVHKRIVRALMDATGANYVDHRAALPRFDTAVLHLYVSGMAPVDQGRAEELARVILHVASPWASKFREAIEDQFHENESAPLHFRYGQAFSSRFQEATSPEQAALDVARLEEVRHTHRLCFDLLPEDGEDSLTTLLRIYHEHDLLLSDVLPVLSRFGLAVLEESTEPVRTRGGASLLIDTYRIRLGERTAHLHELRASFLDALRACFENDMEVDDLCRLCITARVTWRELDVVRAGLHYLRQAGGIASGSRGRRVLIDHPGFVSALVRLFRARFDPRAAESDSERNLIVEQRFHALSAYRAAVSTFEEDRVLAALMGLFGRAMSRINFFLPHRRMKHLVAFKVLPNTVDFLPAPKPRFEIFVHHTWMEGVHMRAGLIARGGLRFSDRTEDYRTEVLGLMLTQRVKNAIIVPTGAKGGFILKADAGKSRFAPPGEGAPDDMVAWAYDQLIEGLLDLTDTQTLDGVSRPPELVAHDGDDPYLVVAADKGTARFSDRANRVAARRRFWLDDAFASGGSVGFDHKKMGITALGAWTCARRHFLELGIDPEHDPVRVVGIGDMSGDVFGNGLLLSRTLRLIAAFNHQHIFVDPDPDPELSWKERKRLFDLQRSSWHDYDRSALSPGGDVYRRDAREINVSREVRDLLGLDQQTISGEALIRAILKLDVDMVWNGGVGTYVKASTERHEDVRDKANDGVRIDAQDLRARVMVEGGNLGITQAGRIEYAQGGGHLNPDFVDNSGGVDCSDREVNLKILFREAMLDGELQVEDRNALLPHLEREVADLVLAHNHGQALMLSLEEQRVARSPFGHLRTQAYLADSGVLDVNLHGLPRTEDIGRRGASGRRPYTRPELAVLCAHAKIHLQRCLLETSRSAPAGEEAVRAYFPASLRERFEPRFARHPLRRPIAAMVQANAIINEGGATVIARLVTDTGGTPVEVAEAWNFLDTLFELPPLREALEGLETPRPGNRVMPPAAHYVTRLSLNDGLRQATTWLMHLHPGPRLGQLLRRSGRFPDLAHQHVGMLRRLLPDLLADQAENLERSLQRFGMDSETASAIAVAPYLPCAVSLATLSRRRRRSSDLDYLTRLYFEVARQTRLLHLYRHLAGETRPDAWDDRAIRTLKTHLLGYIHDLTGSMAVYLRHKGNDPDRRRTASEAHDTTPSLSARVRGVLFGRLGGDRLVADVDAALRRGAGLGHLVVFSEAYRRRSQRLAAMADSAKAAGHPSKRT